MKKKKRFTAKELKNFKLKLQREKERLTKELKKIEEDKFPLGPPPIPSELLSYDDDSTDTASEVEEIGRIAAMEGNIHRLMKQIEGALDKIDKGTYGVCDSCGGVIEKARLKVKPSATLCIKCKSKQEKLK